MSRSIKLPVLGEKVEEAEVLKLLVTEGDAIEKDQPLAELETDKATVEIPAPCAGVIRAIHVAEGDRVRVGQVLFELEDDAEQVAAEPPADDEERRDETPAQDSSPAPAARARGKAQPSEAEEPASPQPPRARGEAQPSEAHETAAPAAPSVRRLARELGIDVADVAGSGPGGRISVEDLKAHARRLLSGPAADRSASGPAAGSLALPDFTAFGAVEREPLRGVRRKTAEAMTRSWVTIPHVTQHDRADITELDAARRRYASRAEAAGAKLTVTAIALKVLASALRIFPRFNASIDMEREEVVLKKYLNLGVAVDTEHGLIVPVIHDVDRKNLLEIAAELADLSERARSRKIRPTDLQGASATLTNLGGLGTTYFSPLVNWPEVVVLGLGRAHTEALHRDGGFVPRLVLPLSVSYDHRLIDGGDAARFLRWIAEALQDPFLLALEG